MKKHRRFSTVLTMWILLWVVGMCAQSPAVKMVFAGAAPQPEAAGTGEELEYDPWEPFNEKMFEFNRNVDRYVLKPVAQGYDFLLPDPVQTGIANAMDNLGFVKRFVNSLLQLKVGGAGREMARFAINSTFGVGGFINVASAKGLEIAPSDEDTGQTLGVYGAGPGPYLILPFLSPLTVRDGIGYAADGAMNPLNYFIPFAATVGIKTTDTVNYRSRNLDRFERVEESVVDLYGAVRNAYLQSRAAAIKQ